MTERKAQWKTAIGALILVALLVGLALASRSLFASGSGAFEEALSKSWALALGLTFVAGLAMCLTGCVYPMIAITVSVFGAREAKSRVQAAALSSMFVLGVIALFTPLGVAAALSGAVFGSALSSIWVICGLSLFYATLASSMFGAFEFALPASVTNRLATVGGVGYRGAFALGLVTALIAAPCTGPFMTGVLGWIARERSVGVGTAVMATFALGLGTPFFAVGTFAISLPKAGAWMLGVKWFFGLVLAVLALHVLRDGFPALRHIAERTPAFAAGAGAITALGFGLMFVHVAAERKHSRFARLSTPFRLVSIPPAVVGSFLLLSWALTPAGNLNWMSNEPEALKVAMDEHRPLIVDFGAEWCAACKELSLRTFSDPDVRREGSRFVALQIDATDDEEPTVKALLAKYKVVGLPTVVVLDSRGTERHRFNDFVPADTFLAEIRGVH